MKAVSYCAAIALLLCSGSVLAERLTCESSDRKRVECEMDTRGGVELIRQLSKTDCRQGHNWDYTRRGVWVDDGCRAVFASGRDEGGWGSRDERRDDREREREWERERRRDDERRYDDRRHDERRRHDEEGYGGPAASQLPPQVARACLDEGGRRSEIVEASGLELSWYTVILRLPDGYYRCTVMENGRVKEFVRIDRH